MQFKSKGETDEVKEHSQERWALKRGRNRRIYFCLRRERWLHVHMKDYGKRVSQEVEKSRSECWADLGLTHCKRIST